MKRSTKTFKEKCFLENEKFYALKKKNLSKNGENVLHQQ